jgi:hypothetical protein
MKKGIQIFDGSGDRKYFTQVPNMIVNHSTAYEQSLYLIMKRIAGEDGYCYASYRLLAEKMGVRRNTVAVIIDKLLKRKWISEVSPIKIRGGSVRRFTIVDLWKLNMKEYEESGSQTHRVDKVAPLFPEVAPKRTGSGSQTDTKKNLEEEPIRRLEILKSFKEGLKSSIPFKR